MARQFSPNPGELFTKAEAAPSEQGHSDMHQQVEAILNADTQAAIGLEGSLDTEQALELLEQQDIATADTEATAARTMRWLTADREDLPDRLKEAEQAFITAIRANKQVTLPALRLLTEMVQYSEGPYLNMELVSDLDANPAFSEKAEQFYATLNSLNHPKGNVILHKLLDYAEMHQLTLHNEFTTSKFDTYYDDSNYWYSFYDRFGEFAEREIKKTANYLIKKHFQNVLDIRNLNRIDQEKPDRLEGWVVGATDDETIYTTRNLGESYANRIKLGLVSGLSGEAPVFPLMPGYVGKYRNGKLEAIYNDESIYEQAEIEQKVRQQNNPEDEELFYRVFNRAWFEQSDVLARSPNNQAIVNAELARAIDYYFRDHLRKANRYLFIDTDKIDDYDQLPLVIKRHLQSINDEAVEAYFKQAQLASARPVPKEQWEKLLSPVEPLSEEAAYNFRYISNIATRKRIEDDLGLKLAQLPAYGQRAFLEYVSHNKVEDFNSLKQALDKRQDEALKVKIATTFFACAEDQGNAEYILTLANQVEHNEMLGVAFDKYLSIVERLTTLEAFVRESFPNLTEAPAAEVRKIARRIQHRANGFLHDMAGKSLDSQAVLNGLSVVDADLISLGTAMKELKRKGLLQFQEIAGLELVSKPASQIEQHEIDELLALQLKTRVVVEEYNQAELLQSLQAELESYIKSGPSATFKILYREGNPIGFIHVHPDEHEPNTMWIGGLNMHPSGQGTPLTEAIVDEIKREYFGKYTCKLEVLKDKLDLQRYYASLGFRFTGQQNPQAGKTFLVMERPPDQPAILRTAA